MSKEFIDSGRNDSFAILRGLDLEDLLIQTENYFLEYRDTLNLPDDVIFGVEIEYENILKIFTDQFVKKKLIRWCSKSDGSLDYGGEITSPIMTDKIEDWKELKMVCDYLTKRKADTLHNAGGHIHIGTCVLGDDIIAWKHFLKLYIAYENVLFRFIYGDKISGRKKLFKYAPPIADKLYDCLDQINNARNLLDFYWFMPSNKKYAALSFYHTDFDNPNNKYNKNTLEFRSPNATTDAVIWQNNINTFTKMLVSAREKVMDEEFLDYKLKHEFYPYLGNEYLYNDINLKNVLEFVDLVFDNNLDKIYFLRQYLKNFQDNYGIKIAVRAKKFVK